jgi:hypothetical protein
MKKIFPFIVTTILLYSCNNKTDKGTNANNRGPNDGREPEIVKVKDTIDVFDIIERNTAPKEMLDGGSTEEVIARTITSYNDANKDTILTTVHYKGIMHPPAIGNQPPDKPFERNVHYKLYKSNGEWKMIEILK